MIQRIQSVYLFLAFVAAVLFLFVPAFGFLEGGEERIFRPVDNLYLLGLTAIIGMLTLINIFLYKNRVLQLKVIRFTVIFTLFLAGAMIYLFYSGSLAQGEEAVVLKPAASLPLVVLLLQWLAYLGIRKDERLVRSLDRLR